MKIILCADDYAQNPDISQGIMDLVEKHRLSAVSCMTNTPYWPEHSGWLKPFADQIDVGLHFNLTESLPLNLRTPFFSLSRLLIQSFLRGLNLKAIRMELNAQLDAFEEKMDQEPDFIDGHQHIHQFPQVRDILLDVYEKRFQKKHPYIRIPLQRHAKTWKDWLKIQIIRHSGSYKLQTLLKEKNIPHNDAFSGSYALDQAHHYSEYFPSFLATLDGNFNLIMCHPGRESIDVSDALYAYRKYEHGFLMNVDFSTLLPENPVFLVNSKNIRY